MADRRKSQYSLYYSAEADPDQPLLRPNTLRSKSSHNLIQAGGGRLASRCGAQIEILW